MTRNLSVLYFILLFTFGSGILVGQDPTNLHLFQLDRDENGGYHLHTPQWLSGFNSGGYTNQPCFTPSGDILVSVKKESEFQNDIWQLSPATHLIRKLTATTTSEFSPRLHPDGKRITVVRQVMGDSLDQQLYEIPLAGGRYQSLIPDIKDIGYYTWLGKDTLGLFRLEGEGNRMVFYQVPDKKTKRITTSIGRSLHTDPHGALAYVHKFSEDYWYIKTIHPKSSLIDIVVETPLKAEDFTMAQDGTYFIGQGSKLFYFHPDRHTIWKELANLSIYGIDGITRLALTDDGQQLAVVSQWAR